MLCASPRGLERRGGGVVRTCACAGHRAAGSEGGHRKAVVALDDGRHGESRGCVERVLRVAWAGVRAWQAAVVWRGVAACAARSTERGERVHAHARVCTAQGWLGAARCTSREGREASELLGAAEEREPGSGDGGPSGARAAERRRRRSEEGKRKEGKWKKKKRKKEKEKEEERELLENSAAIATGDRAWATGSRATRDGTAARKKREGTVSGKRKRWNND